MTVPLPYLTGRPSKRSSAATSTRTTTSSAQRAHDRHTLLVLALVIVAAVLVRWVLTYLRRMIAGRVSLGDRVRPARARSTAHLQRLELGFFDRQQTGQLMSRATVDLQAVRFFLGYGLVFILQSGAHDRCSPGVAMIAINPGLGADRDGPGAVRGVHLPALRPRARARRSRRSSSGSPS